MHVGWLAQCLAQNGHEMLLLDEVKVKIRAWPRAKCFIYTTVLITSLQGGRKYHPILQKRKQTHETH